MKTKTIRVLLEWMLDVLMHPLTLKIPMGGMFG